MVRARGAILAGGGARRCNVFTRILLALFGEVPWRAVPVMPVEIMLLPSWSPFHIAKVSYWSRTVLVPLLVLMALRPRARNPLGISIATFSGAAGDGAGLDRRSDLLATLGGVRHARPAAAGRRAVLSGGCATASDRQSGHLCHRAPQWRGWPWRHLSGDGQRRDEFDCRGYSPDHPGYASALASLRKLLVLDGERSYCQPCLSPVWDTALASHALMEVEDIRLEATVRRALDWLQTKQVLEVVGGSGVRPPRPAARRVGIPIREPLLPRSR